MATITLEYDARNELAMKTVEYISSLGVFKVRAGQSRKMSGIDLALQDVREGKVTRLKNIENPIEEILG
jgi:hypothetical protein